MLPSVIKPSPNSVEPDAVADAEASAPYPNNPAVTLTPAVALAVNPVVLDIDYDLEKDSDASLAYWSVSVPETPLVIEAVHIPPLLIVHKFYHEPIILGP